MTLLPGGTLQIIYLIDSIALEPHEQFVLELELMNFPPEADPSLPNVFFRKRQIFTIQDSTGKTINIFIPYQLTEQILFVKDVKFYIRDSVRTVIENDRFVPITVGILGECILASDFSLVLTPKVACSGTACYTIERPYDKASLTRKFLCSCNDKL